MPVSKSFRVGIIVRGRLISAGHPFGRWTITSEQMFLSAFFPLRFPSFEIPRDEIEKVVLYRGWSGVTQATILDRGRTLERIRVQVPADERARRALQALDYPVVAYDEWLRLRLPRRRGGWQKPPQHP